MTLLSSVLHWLKSQSDLGHNCLVVGATSAAIPAVINLKAPCTAFVNIASVAVMYGTQNWVSWVAGPTMFVNMERSAFGDLQARLFPKMGMVTWSMSSLALASYLANHSWDNSAILLSASLFFNLLNSFVLFPVTTKYQYKIRELEEGTPEKASARKMFGMLHGTSVLVNLGSMAANTAYLYIIASNLTGF